MALAYNIIRAEQKKREIRKDLKDVEKSFRNWGLIVLGFSIFSAWGNVVVASIFLPVDENTLSECEAGIRGIKASLEDSINQNDADWRMDGQRIIDRCEPLTKRVAQSVRSK